jgi:uncharacterized repeat protein (TIGR03803 family)
MSFTKLTQAALLLLVALTAVPSGWAQTFTVLYEFTGHADGAFPISGVIRDSAGNLYGTAASDGEGGYYGSVFKVTSAGKFKLLHSFGANKTRGAVPMAGLTLDSAGNLYGTTSCGGTSNYGTVFRVDKYDTYSALYNFPEPWMSAGCFGGPYPGSLTLDAAGNLYGSGGGGKGTCNGGFNCGAVFKLDPSGNETVIRAFLYGKKGFFPNLGLIRDASGNLYGTTVGGGTTGAGVVFKLDSAGNETVLYTFKRMPDGSEPHAGLIQDTAGNFYGTTVYGGNGPGYCPQGCGVVFKLDANGNETVLYAFAGKSDGGGPVAPLVMDSAGNLYGTTNYEGGGCVCGVVFKLDPSGKETVLHTFTGGTDGGFPEGGLTMDPAGNLYGTTYTGGNLNDCQGGGCGVVFKITP